MYMARISYDEERKLTKALLHACGMSEEDADIAGDVVTHSDFTGVYSHGMSRLALYLKLFGTGAYNPKPNVKVIKEEVAFETYKQRLTAGQFQLYLAETNILNNCTIKCSTE